MPEFLTFSSEFFCSINKKVASMMVERTISTKESESAIISKLGCPVGQESIRGKKDRTL